jgi:hypothetical protein
MKKRGERARVAGNGDPKVRKMLGLDPMGKTKIP